MITTSREAVNALDIWHRSVIEVMADRGLVKVIDDEEQKRPGASE
jgi:hypothetical protein